MGGQDGAGPGAGEDRFKQVIELRERILQLTGHDCNEEETELLDDLNMCKRDTLIELCHSFDITGSRANRKEELVSFLMKFLKNNCSRTNAMIPVKVSDLREQILQLAEHACHEEDEKSRSELLERLNVCKRDTLIELCRSFDLIGSRANRKEELVSFLMKFMKEHSSPIDDTNPDKKIKKRRRPKEENLSSGKPLKKKKQQGTALEAQDEEEAPVREAVENQRNYSECVGMDYIFLYADSKNCKISNDKANLGPTVVTTSEFDSTSMKASKKKNTSVTKEKATPKNDHRAKSCGKMGSKRDTIPRRLVMKPSRDELREAIVLILDSTDFATMTFGDVVTEVDKYFGKDLFERKPLIRSLIEEELFRLSEEAEKKELEEEATEAKARAEQSTEDCGNGNEKYVRDGPSVKINSNAAAEGLHNGKANADTKIGDNKPTNDGNCEKVSPGINNVVDIQGSRNGEVATVNVKNNNVDAQEGSNDGITKEACNGEHDDNEYDGIEGGRSENGGNNAENINACEAGESRSHADDGRVEHAGDGKAEEASKENSNSVVIHGDNDGKEKEGNIDLGQSLTDSCSGGKAEDVNHNMNTKVDVDSGKNGDAENGKTG